MGITSRFPQAPIPRKHAASDSLTVSKQQPQNTRDYKLFQLCQRPSIPYDKVCKLIAAGANPRSVYEKQSALEIVQDLVFFQNNEQNEVNLQILELFLRKIPTLQPSNANFGSLPLELRVYIFDFFRKDRKLIDLALVSKDFRSLVNHILQRDWIKETKTLPSFAMQAKKIERENPKASAVVKTGIFAKQLFPKSKITTASLEELVQKETSQSLVKLWKEIQRVCTRTQQLPTFKRISELRAWFKAEEAKPILATILEINLSTQNISILPSEIGKLVNLQKLDLSGNQLQGLPPEIGKLANLQMLDLSGNQLQELPPEIGNLRNLTETHLSGNKLQEVPKEIGNLINLRSLAISGNKLQEVPKEIGNLINLRSLAISSNKLRKLPPGIGNLTNLKGFYLSNNQLQELPPETGKLEKLEKLDLKDNQLQELPPEIGNLRNLTETHLSGNKLQEVPKEIGNLINLKSLAISGNKLRKLPSEIGNLTNLQWLPLLDNQLQTLPSRIGNLTNLEELYLSNNQLQELPPEIGNLRKLRILSLQDNQLRTLPPEIGGLKNLQELDLEGNPPYLVLSQMQIYFRQLISTILQ